MPSSIKDINDDLPAEQQAAVKKLVDEFDNKGVGVSMVPDGAVFMFKREYLQKLLDSDPKQDKFVMYIRRPGAN